MSELLDGIFCPVCSCVPCQCSLELECEHPRACISARYQRDDNPQQLCGWCADVARATAAERERITSDILHKCEEYREKARVTESRDQCSRFVYAENVLFSLAYAIKEADDELS